MQTLFEQNAEGTDEPIRISPVLMLEDLGVSHKDAVTYYAFAEDITSASRGARRRRCGTSTSAVQRGLSIGRGRGDHVLGAPRRSKN